MAKTKTTMAIIRISVIAGIAGIIALFIWLLSGADLKFSVYEDELMYFSADPANFDGLLPGAVLPDIPDGYTMSLRKGLYDGKVIALCAEYRNTDGLTDAGDFIVWAGTKKYKSELTESKKTTKADDCHYGTAGGYSFARTQKDGIKYVAAAGAEDDTAWVLNILQSFV